MNKMRFMLQKQLPDDYLNQAKTKETNVVSLSEVFRIGQQAEKQQQITDGIDALIHGKVREQEQRLSGAEQSYNLVNRKGDATSQFFDEFSKMEGKVLQLDYDILLIKGETFKDKKHRPC